MVRINPLADSTRKTVGQWDSGTVGSVVPPIWWTPSLHEASMDSRGRGNDDHYIHCLLTSASWRLATDYWRLLSPRAFCAIIEKPWRSQIW